MRIRNILKDIQNYLKWKKQQVKIHYSLHQIF